MKSEHKVLYEKIDKFLATQNPTDSGWAKVADGEMGDLGTIFDQIIRYKYEEDADGDLPIDFMLVNRNHERFILSGFVNITPYDISEENKTHEVFIALLRALNIITEQVQLFFRFERELSIVEKKKEE